MGETWKGLDRPEVVLGPSGGWKTGARYAMHNPGNSSRGEFRKRIALKEHLRYSEGRHCALRDATKMNITIENAQIALTLISACKNGLQQAK